MNARMLGVVLSALLSVVGCSSPGFSPWVAAQAARKTASRNTPTSFVNRVWVVAESQHVAPGDLRVFLSDGTFVQASPHGTPSLGRWWRSRDGHLTITEEGLQYDVEIIELSEDVFRIRVHSPGEPVDILLKPAARPPVQENSADQPDRR